MTKDESKEVVKKNNQKLRTISFKCQSCGKQKSIEDMRVITRFFPMPIVCLDCEKEMR